MKHESVIHLSKKHSKIFIYGAGIVGKQCLTFLHDNGISVQGFIVTNKTQSSNEDGEILCLDDLSISDDIGIIIAGSIKNSIDMHLELIKQGINNYVFFKEEIEDRVLGAISFIADNSSQEMAVLGSGTVMKAVLDRCSNVKDLYIISDEYRECFLHNQRVNSFIDGLKKGVKKIVIAEDADKTSEAFIRYCDIAKENEIELYDAYGIRLNRESFVDAELAKESGYSKCALVIDSAIPKYDMNAGARLSYYYMHCLKRLGYSVWLLPLESASNEYKCKYESDGIHVVSDMEYGKSWIYVNGNCFDLVFLQRAECAEYYLDSLLQYCAKARLIFHPADLHFLRLERQYEITGDKSLKVQAKRYKEIECRTIECSDFVYVVGSAEKRYVEELSPGKKVRDIPIYLYDENKIPIRLPASERSDLIFVGGFGHNPNIDAVRWFAQEILPMVVKRIPEVICHVVGGKAPENLVALGNKNLVIEGYVSDEKLEELYQECRLSIAPLRFGAGIKGKIIEAAYYGLPVVTTSIGVEGVHDAEKFIAVADSAESFANAVIRLYDDFERIDAIANATKEVIADNYTSKVAEDILRADLEMENAV